MATGRINRQIIDYIESMEKKAKQMSYVKNLKNECPNATKTKPPIKLSKV